MDWKDLALSSHYQTAVAIKEMLKNGEFEESEMGLEELIEALSRSDKRALKSQLTRLMMHIIKWRIQPQRRSRGWLLTISNARVEIEELLEDEPHLKSDILKIWDKCLKNACQFAKDETGISPNISELTKEEVFEKEYVLEDN